MSHNGLRVPRQHEDTMDLFIETLTGTAFEMTVSPFDTVKSIKSKIQRVEGIPVSHQHLLYNLQELDDSQCLIDYSIQNGATLKLVLSMRGGPISTRRLPHTDDHTWKELREFVENNKEDMFEHLPPGCRVTVLMFRDGDHINLFRVIENDDGSYSPLSESWSGTAIRNLFAEEDADDTARKLKENSVTMEKMQELRQKMASLSLLKKPKKTGPRVLSAKKPLLHSRRNSGRVHHKPKSPEAQDNSKHEKNTIFLPPIQKSDLPKNQQSYLASSSILTCEPKRSKHRELQPMFSDNNFPSNITLGKDSHIKNSRKQSSLRKVAVSESLPCTPVIPEIKRLSADYNKLAGNSRNSNFNRKPSGNVLGTSKIAIVEEESDSSLEKEPFPSSSAIPITSKDAAAFALTPVPCERLGTVSSAGNRYRLSRFIFEDDDRPKTSPDKFDRPHTKPEVCSLLSQTKWHTNHQLNDNSSLPTVLDLPSKTEGEFGSMKNTDDDNGGSDLFLNSSVHSPRYRKSGRAIKDNKKAVISIGKLNSSREKNINSDVQSSPFRRVVSGRRQPNSASVESVQTPKKRTIRPRCSQCRKKLNITNVYSCRCGKIFCASHRYSELHNCNFDYKNEGRKLLEQANPLITAPKLPKI